MTTEKVEPGFYRGGHSETGDPDGFTIPEPKKCSIERDWYGKPHGPHKDGHDCWEESEGGPRNGYYCGICGFLVQVS